MSSFETLQRHYRDHNLAVNKRKEEGGKVVGYFCTNTPEEIIYAGGMLPVRLVGDPSLPTTVGDLYMEDSYCSLVRAIFDQILRGNFNHLDAMVIPHSCDAIIRGAKYLWLVKDMEGIQFPDMYWVAMPRIRNWLSQEYYIGVLRTFKKEMEELSGKAISDDSLFNAIEVYNKNRALMQKIVALRRSDPPRISGTVALQAIGAGLWMDKADHNKLMEQFLQELDQIAPPDPRNARMFVSGSCMDKIETAEFVESCGATIVGDDICTGDRFAEGLTPLLADPVEAIAHRYLFKPVCPRIEPMWDRIADFSRRVKESKPQAVLFYILRWCDAHMWTYVALRDELQKLGIPHYYLDMQEYRITNPESLRTRIQALVESVS